LCADDSSKIKYSVLPSEIYKKEPDRYEMRCIEQRKLGALISNKKFNL